MLTTSILLMFLVALLVVYITPGPDMLLVLGTAIGQGTRPALHMALGLALSRFIHAMLAAVGVSSLLAASPLAFEVMRYAGALYLLWLAWHSLQQKTVDLEAGNGQNGFWSCFRKGLLTNLFNPKIVIFCSLLLPQFVVAEQGHILLQFLLLGCLLALVGLIMDCLYALGAGRLAARFQDGAGAARIQKWLLSSVFAGLAVRLLLLENVAAR